MSASSRPAAPIYELFPCQTINYLISGSQAGKTNFILNQLNDYAEGRGFLGYSVDPDAPTIDADDSSAAPAPVNPLYTPIRIGAIACGRSEKSLREETERFSFLKDPKKFPIATIGRIQTRERDPGVDGDMAILHNAYDELTAIAGGHSCRLLLIQNIQALMGSGKLSDLRAVWEFCQALYEFCDQRKVTILGMINTSKTLRGQYYAALGDRIFGSVGWGQAASSMIALESCDAEKRIEHRSTQARVIIQTRRAPIKAIYANFDHAGFFRVVDGPQDPEEKKVPPSFAILDRRLDEEPPGVVLTKETVVDWEMRLRTNLISERTIERWLGARSEADQGFLERSGSGRGTEYKKPLPN